MRKIKIKTLFYWIFQIFIITGLIWFLKKINFSLIKQNLVSIEYFSFFSGLFLIILVNLFRPVRSLMILKKLGVLIEWWQLFRWNQEALFLALLTPGKMGEFYKALLIERTYKINGAGIFITFFERWIDMVLVLLIALIMLILQSSELLNTLCNIAVIILMTIILVTIAIILSERMRGLIKNCVRIIPNKYIQNKLGYSISGISKLYRKLDYGSLLKFILSSILIWLIYILGFCILLGSLKIDLSIVQIISCTILVLFVQSVPITFLGFGTREATLIFYLNYYGLNSLNALSVSFLFVSVSLAQLFISGSFWVFHNKMIKINFDEN